MSSAKIQEILPDLYRIEDSCNVYLLRHGKCGLAIDYGSGAWRSGLADLGIEKLDHVLLTHHHPDQCHGLQQDRPVSCTVHAPAGAAEFLQPENVSHYWKTRWANGCPRSYAVLTTGIGDVAYDLAEANDLFWCNRRIRFLATPGHGQHAHSIIITHADRQIVFCGDAVHAEGTVHEPFNLEWDHWTGSGALAAWCGLKRLSQISIDLLCPSHGPLVHDPQECLQQLLQKLMRFYESKLSISPEEPDNYWQPQMVTEHFKELLPHLYQFGSNGFLLLSENGEGLVVDPQQADLPALAVLHAECGRPRITAALVSHYHHDHCNAADDLRATYGTIIWLHPWVAKPLENVQKYDVPWLWTHDIVPDRLLPEEGSWQWNEYTFKIAPFPGQTWWHAAHQTKVDGRKIFFGGDNFQPPSRWNGTGGYCAYNGSRFQDGFVRSAQLVQDWQPDLLCCGHNTFYSYNPEQFDKIIAWAQKTEKIVKALCPSGNLETDYYSGSAPQDPIPTRQAAADCAFSLGVPTRQPFAQ